MLRVVSHSRISRVLTSLVHGRVPVRPAQSCSYGNKYASGGTIDVEERPASQGRPECGAASPRSCAARAACADCLGKTQELPPPTGFVLLPGQARTLLPGGRILVTGGASKDGPVADAWLLDPATGLTAKLPAGLREARAFHTATILPDGAVLILGGVGADGLAATELFTRPRHSRSISCRYPG